MYRQVTDIYSHFELSMSWDFTVGGGSGYLRSDCEAVTYTGSAESKAMLSCLEAQSWPPWGGDTSRWESAQQNVGVRGEGLFQVVFPKLWFIKHPANKMPSDNDSFLEFSFKSCSPKPKRSLTKSGLISLRVVFKSKVTPKVTIAQSHRHAFCVTSKSTLFRVVIHLIYHT